MGVSRETNTSGKMAFSVARVLLSARRPLSHQLSFSTSSFARTEEKKADTRDFSQNESFLSLYPEHEREIIKKFLNLTCDTENHARNIHEEMLFIRAFLNEQRKKQEAGLSVQKEKEEKEEAEKERIKQESSRFFSLIFAYSKLKRLKRLQNLAESIPKNY